jgi:hypothetical protein
MPEIQEYRFGHVKINGKSYSDDVKIIGGEVRPDWWRKRGHSIETDDVRDVIAAGPETFVLGTGASANLRMPSEFEKTMKEQGIEVVAQPTEQAVQTYNRLEEQGADVAAGFHLTC